MSNRTLRLFAVSLTAFFLVLVQGCARTTGSQNMSNQGGTTHTFGDAQTAANESLATFRKLVTNENYKELGFDSPDQLSKASLGSPMQVFAVQLDKLREYREGTDANTLLGESVQVYFPVTVDGQAKTAVVVEQVQGKWRSASFGNAGLAKQIAALNKASATSNAATGPSDMIVQIPALGVYFLGSRNADNKLMLTALGANAALGLQAGSTEAAETVFARLAPLAKNYNGLPM